MLSFAQNLNFNIFTPFYLNVTPVPSILDHGFEVCACENQSESSVTNFMM